MKLTEKNKQHLVDEINYVAKRGDQDGEGEPFLDQFDSYVQALLDAELIDDKEFDLIHGYMRWALKYHDDHGDWEKGDFITVPMIEGKEFKH